MSYNTILVDQENHIGIITLNRPDELNTFSSEMAIELNQALTQLDNDENIRVLIIKGAGKAFCAGQMYLNFLVNPIWNTSIGWDLWSKWPL